MIKMWGTRMLLINDWYCWGRNTCGGEERGNTKKCRDYSTLPARATPSLYQTTTPLRKSRRQMTPRYWKVQKLQ